MGANPAMAEVQQLAEAMVEHRQQRPVDEAHRGRE